MTEKRVALSLFWRTFILLALLLCGGIFAWVQTLRTLESEPRVVLAAQQIASTVNLVREGMRHADRINRVALVKAMSARETIRVLPREPGDKWAAFETDDAVHVLHFGGQHDDGREVIGGAQAAADGQPVFAGQHQVEHDEIDVLAAHQPSQGFAVFDQQHF